MKELYENYITKSDVTIMDMPEKEEREKRTESLFKQIVVKNFPHLWKELDTGIQEANRTPNYFNSKRPSPRHIMLKLSKIKDNDRILNVAREVHLISRVSHRCPSKMSAINAVLIYQ